MSITLIRLGLIAAILAGFFSFGWHEKGIRDEAVTLAAANAQMLLDKQAQAQIEARAATAEKALADQKQMTYDISKRWEAERAKPHSHCKLSDSTVGVLRDATKPTGRDAR